MPTYLRRLLKILQDPKLGNKTPNFVIIHTVGKSKSLDSHAYGAYGRAATTLVNYWTSYMDRNNGFNSS